MHDRVPLYPGRVKMTPVAGQANIFDMVRADDPTQAGTPLNKATFLKDATAALFGLGTNAVPDDVLAELGKYKQYWWRRRTPSKTQYVEKQNNVTSENENSGIQPYGTTVWVSNTIHFNPTTGGDITLVNPEGVVLDSWDSVSTGVIQVSKITNKAPCYLKVRNIASDTTYYLPTGSTATSWSSGNGTMQVRYQSSVQSVYFGRSSSVPVIAKVVTNELGNIPESDWEYLHSSTRSAYPDGGTSGGYEYEYLGIPFDNAVTAPKIETGSYVGTGTYGQANPNTLTFGFVPKLVFIFGFYPTNSPRISGYNGTFDVTSLDGEYKKYGYLINGWSDATDSSNAKISVHTLSWYSTYDRDSQLNNNGARYRYIAIG